MSAPVKHLGIVVAVDDSPASNAATCWAAREAVRSLPLTLVNVVATPSATYPPVPYPESFGAMAGRPGTQGRRPRGQDRRRCDAHRPEGRGRERDRIFDPSSGPGQNVR